MPDTPTLGARQQSLIDAYLADLTRNLHRNNPDDADDIEQSVREHVDSALAGIGTPTMAQVQAILDELGPIERIASPQERSDKASIPPAGVNDIEAHTTSDGPIALTVLIVLGIVATVLSVFWFIAVPLGAVVLIASLLGARHATQAARTAYRVSATLGAAAIIIALIFALFLTAATTG